MKRGGYTMPPFYIWSIADGASINISFTLSGCIPCPPTSAAHIRGWLASIVAMPGGSAEPGHPFITQNKFIDRYNLSATH